MSSAQRRSVATRVTEHPFQIADWEVATFRAHQKFTFVSDSVLKLRSQSVVDSYEVPSAVDLGVGVPANSTSKRYRVSCTVPTHGRISEPSRSSEGGVIEGRLAVRALRRAGGAGVPRAGRRRGGLLVGGMDCEASFVEQLLGPDTDAGEE